MSDRRCERGTRCVAWERDQASNARLGAPLVTDGGLCETCTRWLVFALAELPRDYTDLAVALASGGGSAENPVSGTPELPIPIRTDVEALQAEMLHETLCWTESVAEVVGAAVDTQRMAHVRPGFAIQRCSRLLAGSVSVLLALRAVEHTGWLYGRPAVLVRSGLDGACLFLDLHHRTRSLLGLTRLTHHHPVPCPRCEATALYRDNGSETVQCGACLRRYHWDYLQQLCSVLAHRREFAA